MRDATRGDSVSILMGTLTNRRTDTGWEDGAGIRLSPHHFGDYISGTWAEWGIAADGRGTFCAERLR